MEQSLAQPSLFYGPRTGVALEVHVDDFEVTGPEAEMEKLSKNLSKEQIDKVFARFDSDGDGRLSYAEFRKMMTKEK